MAAALPEIPTCALKLGDKTSATSVPRGHSAGFTRVRSFRVRGLGFIDKGLGFKVRRLKTRSARRMGERAPLADKAKMTRIGKNSLSAK